MRQAGSVRPACKGSFSAGQTDFLPGAEGQRERRCALRSHRVSLVPPGKVTTYTAERSCRAHTQSTHFTSSTDIQGVGLEFRDHNLLLALTRNACEEPLCAFSQSSSPPFNRFARFPRYHTLLLFNCLGRTFFCYEQAYLISALAGALFSTCSFDTAG